ncbi:ABC transporter B family member 1-like [Ostrea edulis]|uniref:ABC transporter B family member 1-like n=1 Tax=Ostrea edulis TaxID=37623 RepID=UPI0024AF2357|nr:ABC transporter B family member 1-like [Ostrea edulis]XP_056012402.1 ABC transporter B family member 1-like [Ostrea edulis]
MAKLNGTVTVNASEVEDEKCDTALLGKHNYTLPSFRYTNIFITIVIIDGMISCLLWLTGGHSKYFVDNIVDFHFKESVFDLALLTALKTVVIVTVLPILENKAYEQIDSPYNNGLRTQCIILHSVLKLTFLGSLAFSVVKGGLVLNCILNDEQYEKMHVTYNVLVISSVSFSVLESLLSLFSGHAMRRLKIVRILHRFNDKGQEVDKEGKPIKKQVDIKRLVMLAKPEWGILLGGSLGLLISSGAQTAAPLFFGAVVDAAQKSMDELTNTVLILVLIYVAYAIFAVIRSWLFTLAGQRLVARLRKHLFHHIIQQEVAFFDTNRTGELCNRLASDTQVVQNAATVNVSMLVRYTLQMLGSLVLMFYLNAALTGVLLAVVPIVSIISVQYGKFVKNMRQKFQDRLADAGTLAEENISSLRTVRSFAGETKASSLYGAEVDKSYEVGKKLAVAYGAFEGLVGILAYGSIAMVLWYGGKLVYDNTHGEHTGLTPGVLTSFLLYTLQVAMAFALMSALYGDFMQAVGASIRIFDLLDRIPDVPTENGEVLYEMSGRVEFQNVFFTYPSRPDTQVLKGISFSVEPGEMVALVGPSGGGKSTIVNLIERFYDPDSGNILLGDVELKTLDPQWFRKKVSMVSQEPTLFASSIKDNIAYGCNATDHEIEEVAKQANAHEFICTFEEGYNTLVGERGVRLSGGQKQRIAIARALIMNPVLLLLDEATSALDAESEHLVQEAIDRAMKGRTVIVIAHRLSTVRNASKVVVIDKGGIAEMGSHDQLLARNGVYKRLVLRQLTAGSLNKPLECEEEQDNSS